MKLEMYKLLFIYIISNVSSNSVHVDDETYVHYSFIQIYNVHDNTVHVDMKTYVHYSFIQSIMYAQIHIETTYPCRRNV